MVKPNLKNAAKALTKLAKAVVTGEAVLVSDKVLKDRTEMCEGVPGQRPKCEFFEPGARQCTVCTCFIDVKANLSTETCPKMKWKE